MGLAFKPSYQAASSINKDIKNTCLFSFPQFSGSFFLLTDHDKVKSCVLVYHRAVFSFLNLVVQCLDV